MGHQAYTHKILSGRREMFDELRQYGGISGFPKRKESPYDAFDTGHSSTSISAGLGMAQGRDILGQDHYVVSVIGDGALTGGMAYEALNNAARMNRNFIIVLNDNNMSISENVGGMSRYLNGIRTGEGYNDLKRLVNNSLEKVPVIGRPLIDKISRTKNGIKQLLIPGMLFENMGITYLGPVDGHDIHQMVRVFQEAKRFEGPILVHVLTKKGQGYEPALRHPSRFHGAGPFEIETGLPISRSNPTYTDIFSTVMRKMGDREPDVVAVTAAMPTGVGLKRFSNMFPDRCFDVGIAEEHAVTFAAGLALGGMIPVVAIYSSFLQRAYDQMMHDVCMQELHVVFAIDRAGLVGSDGETHHGVFDLSYLNSMPNMTVMAPKNLWELSDMMKFAVHFNGPIALRYPRGEAYTGLQEHRAPIRYGKAEVLEQGEKIALLAVGNMVKTAVQVRKLLQEQGYQVTLVNMRFVKPFDMALVRELSGSHELLVTMEENVRNGGFGEQVASFVMEEGLSARVQIIALPNRFVHQGSVSSQMKETGIDAESVAGKILKVYKELEQKVRK